MDIINKYKYIDWSKLSKDEILSEEFIKTYAEFLDWANICTFQKLSENLIRDYLQYINWNCLSACQELSEEFIEEFLDKLNIEYVFRYNKNLSLKIIEKYAYKIKSDPFFI